MPSRNLRAVLLTLVAALIAVVGSAVTRRTPVRAVLDHRFGARVDDVVAAFEPPPEADENPGRCPAEPPIALPPHEIPASTIDLVRRIREAPDGLGSASIGYPTSGRLWGAARLMPSDDIAPSGDQPYGTEAVVRSIERAAREVRRCFPDSPRLFVGDISKKEGGRLKPHHSHQSGLDADIGYYYAGGEKWFSVATAANLDRPRTWALVRALVEGGNVDSIFIDRSIQLLLQEYAAKLDEPGPRLEDMFESKTRKHDVVIHHASGHSTHFHVRFRDPEAVAFGMRLASMVKASPVAAPPHPPRAAATGPKAR